MAQFVCGGGGTRADLLQNSTSVIEQLKSTGVTIPTHIPVVEIHGELPFKKLNFDINVCRIYMTNRTNN